MKVHDVALKLMLTNVLAWMPSSKGLAKNLVQDARRRKLNDLFLETSEELEDIRVAIRIWEHSCGAAVRNSRLMCASPPVQQEKNRAKAEGDGEEPEITW